MTESTFGFMPLVFFVDDVQHPKSKNSRKRLESTSRSHAARVAHEKRKAVKAKGNPEDACGRNQGPAILRNARMAAVPTSIKIFWHVVVPGVRPMCTIFNTRCLATQEWMGYMAQDVFFHAAAAAMHAAHDPLINREFRTRPSQVIFEHRGKAMAALRRHMARGEDITDAMLLTVCFLALLERRYNEMEAHQLHKQALGSLVASRGGLDALPPYIKCLLMQYEFPWAIETGSSVLPRTQRRQPLYPGGSGSKTLQKQIRSLPEGFAALGLQGKISTHLLLILERFTMYPTKGRELDTENESCKLHIGYVFDDFWDAFPQLSFDERDSQEPSLNNLLFLCLLVYAGLRHSPIPQVNSIVVCMRAALHARLVQCTRLREAAEEECLRWIWAVAVSSWRQRDGTLDQPGFQLLERQRWRLGSSSSEEFEKTLRKFFWDDGLEMTCRQMFQIQGRSDCQPGK
ncbi:uncharacterized protein DSM5745_09110 [Aspergillus mulundensis]|uniref:Uncharacterized protein n=1 Tax=Aspergillus mulundensis TaxID=1810919 RepID=A0A3D8R092_9EURO|nr:Uncharacterized protein DSM5745_09110 [Aspergillus mulundensis]RDW67244.1 Uncharacterized protein DSM5745_09110 [Aspergillus mulundensis]